MKKTLFAINLSILLFNSKAITISKTTLDKQIHLTFSQNNESTQTIGYFIEKLENKIDSSKIKIDESHTNIESKETTNYKKHTVIAGETTLKIAQKYKITQQQLISWNNLKKNSITIGQELIVSGNLNIKAYEKWNEKNSLTSIQGTTKSNLSNYSTQIQEVGNIAKTNKISHPNLQIGTIVLCINPENNKQILTQIETNELLIDGCVLGLKNDISENLNIQNSIFRIIINYNQSTHE